MEENSILISIFDALRYAALRCVTLRWLEHMCRWTLSLFFCEITRPRAVNGSMMVKLVLHLLKAAVHSNFDSNSRIDAHLKKSVLFEGVVWFCCCD